MARETSFAIHTYLRNAYLEIGYENLLMNRIGKQGVHVIQQHPIKVWMKMALCRANLFSDMFAEDRLIIALIACKTIDGEHVAQLLEYSRATNIPLSRMGYTSISVLRSCKLISVY